MRPPADRFTVLPGGHYLHRDVPELWVKTVTEFADAGLPSCAAVMPRSRPRSRLGCV